jgi:hypothetical protein
LYVNCKSQGATGVAMTGSADAKSTSRLFPMQGFAASVGSRSSLWLVEDGATFLTVK